MRRLVVLPLLATPLLLAAPAGADDDVTTPATFTTAAWWTSNPVCSGGVACGALGTSPVDPYPAGTLHVAQVPGSESARSYLTLGAVAPVGATLVDALLTLPLDTSATDGSGAPGTSRVWVCTTTATVAAGEDQVGTPPAADCSTHVELTYVDGTVPSLQGDLTPLLALLVKPMVSLALVPATSSATTDNWHVVFSSPSAAAPIVPAPTLAVTYTPAAPDAAGPAPDGATPSSPVPTPAPPSAARASAPVVAGPAPVVVPPVAAALPGLSPPETTEVAPRPEVAPSAPAADPGSPAASDTTRTAGAVSETVGFAYPGVLLLPLVIGGVLFTLGRQLTGSMRPRPSAVRHQLTK